MLYCLTSKNWNSLESTLLGCGGLCASPHLTKGSSVPTAWSQCPCSGATCSVGISLAELQPILKWHGGTYWNLRTRFLSACNPSQRLHPTVLLFRACSSPRRARLPIVLLSRASWCCSPSAEARSCAHSAASLLLYFRETQVLAWPVDWPGWKHWKMCFIFLKILLIFT